jgi:hypothetical protein
METFPSRKANGLAVPASLLLCFTATRGSCANRLTGVYQRLQLASYARRVIPWEVP